MADRKISELPLLEVVNGNEEIPVAHEGSNYKVKTGALKPNLSDYLTSKQAAQKYYPKVDGDNLSDLVDILDKGLGDKEDRVPVEVVSGETLTAKVGRYYRFDDVVNTIEVNLPKVEETDRLKSIVLSFTTGDNQAVTITSDEEIAYFTGYSIESNTTYEINLTFNGTKWIVAYGIVE